MAGSIKQDPPEITFPASGDISGKQFYIMVLDTSGEVKLADDQDDPVESLIGVLQTKPNAQYEEAVIRVAGVAKVLAGDAVTAGEWVTTNGIGKAVTAVSLDHVIGIALTTGVNGSLMEVLLVLSALGYPA